MKILELLKNFNKKLGTKGQTRSDWIAATQARLRGIADTMFQSGKTQLEDEFKLAERRGTEVVREDIGKRNLFGYGGAPSTPGQSQLLDFLEGLSVAKGRSLVDLERERAGILSKGAMVPLQFGQEEEEDDFLSQLAPLIGTLAGAGIGTAIAGPGFGTAAGGALGGQLAKTTLGSLEG